MLAKEKPIFLGVCYRHAHEMGLSIESFRILSLIAIFFIHPLFWVYIIMGLIESSFNSSNSSDQHKREKYAESEVVFDVTKQNEKVDIFAQSESKQSEDVSFDVVESNKVDDSIVVNGVRGEQAVVNAVREYE